jgi:hypothetical protein
MKRAFSISKGGQPEGFGEVSKKNSRAFTFRVSTLSRKMWMWFQYYRNKPSWKTFVENKFLALNELKPHGKRSPSKAKRCEAKCSKYCDDEEMQVLVNSAENLFHGGTKKARRA